MKVIATLLIVMSATGDNKSYDMYSVTWSIQLKFCNFCYQLAHSNMLEILQRMSF